MSARARVDRADRVPGHAAGPRSGTWTNWAGTASCHPAELQRPTSTAEVAAAVAAAVRQGRTLKAVGAGHSFSQIALTDGVMLDLSALCGLDGIDRDPNGGARVRVRAGTRLADLNELLARQGLAMPNLGDIDRQTISGAISTGTHGTGARFGVLASFVTGAQVVLADASIVECSPHVRPELFEASRLGLGAVGVVTVYEIACVPAFLVRAEERPERLDVVLERLEEWRVGTDHVDVFVFPHTDRALVKRNTRLPAGEDGPRLKAWRRRLDDDLLSNTVYERMCRLGARRPGHVPAINELAARALTARTFVAPSHEVYVTRRDVRFREAEWAVPVASVAPLLGELRTYFARRDPMVGIPLEVRFGAADGVWLSTGHGRETGYIAVHEYAGAAPSPYFADVSAMMREHAARPHWGKMHDRQAHELAPLYPRFDDFRAVRDAVDPQRVFGNEYLRRVLGD